MRNIELTILIPAYNEEGNIEILIEKLKEIKRENWEILIINDGSTDRTAEYVDKKVATVIDHEINLGKGEALKTGIRNSKGKFILFMDGDCQDDPYDIPVIFNIIQQDGKLDMVIGSRLMGNRWKNFKKHVKEGSIELTNYIGNLGLSWLIKVLYNIRLTDTQAGFKCFRAEKIKVLDFKAKGYEIETEIIIQASRNKWKITEVPVGRYLRQKGKSNLYDIPFGRLKFGFKVSWLLIKEYFKKGKKVDRTTRPIN